MVFVRFKSAETLIDVRLIESNADVTLAFVVPNNNWYSTNLSGEAIFAPLVGIVLQPVHAKPSGEVRVCTAKLVSAGIALTQLAVCQIIPAVASNGQLIKLPVVA